MTRDSFGVALLIAATIAISSCSEDQKPTSRANTVSSAGAIPVPCPAGQTTTTYTDPQGRLVTANCAPTANTQPVRTMPSPGPVRTN